MNLTTNRLRMRALLLCFAIWNVLVQLPLFAQSSASDYAVQVSAIVQEAPVQINLSWPGDSAASSYSVYRKNISDAAWGTLITLPGSANSFTDTSVSVGLGYEYQIIKTSPGYKGSGYIYTGIKLPLVEYRGRLILMVANTYASALANELAQLQQDLVGDGWIVLRHDVSPTATVSSIKSLIKNDYNADQSNTEAVLLFGHVPVPYSGNLNPDEHLNHKGAWPADVYYGDMTGTWTDTIVNTKTAERPENWNVPGDGKFDQSQIPADIRLQVGRVDLSKLTCYSNKTPARSELDLLRQYLVKDHNFRHKNFSANRRGLIMDNFALNNGVPYGSCGWRNFGPVFGANNIDVTLPNNYFNAATSQSYLWSYACGGGEYTFCDGVGVSDDFALNDIKAVFTMFFGSYYGDWDNESNFLRAVLGSGTALTATCSGLPQWYYQHMGLGQTVGFGNRLTQNNKTNGLYYPQFGGNRQVHISLMGDPALRLHVVAPPSNFQGVPGGGGASLSWNPSTDGGVLGYHVYRASSAAGPFTRLTSSPIPNSTYVDAVGAGNYTYMVKSIRLETSASGSYFNSSQGIFDDVTIPVQTGPSGPTGLALTVQSTSAILLAWMDNASNEDSYRVERRTATGSYMEVASLPANTTSYSDSGLATGTQYFYRVRCSGATGFSFYSAEVSATTLAVPPVFVQATAKSITIDSTTSGSWVGVYGGEGYAVVGATFANPPYVTPTSPDANLFTWGSPVSDVRAPFTSNAGTDRVAAAWYGQQFRLDLNFTDGKTHRVAFYFLDWDRLSRNEDVSIINTTNGATLLTQNITGFSNGAYWVVELSGHVTVTLASRLTTVNAVLSGIFFSPPSTPSPTVGSIQLLNGVATLAVSAQIGDTVLLQSSTDFLAWTSIATNVFSASPYNFQVPFSGQDLKFYRAKALP